MIRSWVLFLLEWCLFTLVLSLVGFFWLEPHLRQGFIGQLETRFGAEVEVKSLFFSPMGRVVGRGMLIEGNRGGKPFRLLLDEFDFASRENIYFTLWEEQEEFDWLNLSYDVEVSGIHWESGHQNLAQASMGKLQGVWEAGGWAFKGLKTLANGTWGLSGIETWSCSYSSRGLGVELGEVHGGGDWGEVNLGALKLEWNDGRGETPLWEKTWTSDEILSSLEEIRLGDGSIKAKDGLTGVLHQLRVQRLGEAKWEGKTSGSLDEQNWGGEVVIEKVEGLGWRLSGEFPVPLWNEPISVEVSGPLNLRGPWKAKLQDLDKNNVEVFANRGEKGFWLGSVKSEFMEWRPEVVDWEPISGKLEGGFSWELTSSILRFKGALDALEGGPARIRNGRAKFDGQFDLGSRYLAMESFEISEGEDWSGNLMAGLFLNPFRPKALEVQLQDFPLGRYSPKADGILSVNGILREGKLSVEVSSPKIFPNRDPLNFMEDFKVEVLCDDEGVNYQQTFVQDSQSRLIEVNVGVEDFLGDPMKMRLGTLRVLRARAGLFDLNLDSEVPVRLNMEGAQVPKFILNDRNERLRRIQGHAFIPFLIPSKLLIEAQAELDLGKLPQLGETQIKGSVEVLDARWDKGWSLANLEARLRGQQINLKPESVFDEIQVKEIEGWMRDSTVILDRVVGETAEGGRVEGKGYYNFRDRDIDISLTSENLSFRSNEYQLIYDLENLRVKGPPLNLDISGNLLAHEFLYSGDFSMMGSSDGERPSLPLQTAASRLIGHHLNLNIRSEKALAIKNNSLDLTFSIEDLLIHGPIRELRWRGRAQSTEREENRISLPLQWLDVSFTANKLSLVFDDQETWNPRAHLQAEAEIEDVKVFLNYDDRLSDLSKGEFNLSSSPAYSRQEILSMLSSGSKPDREIFDEGGSTPVADEAGPSLTLFKSRPRSNRSQALTYSASLNSDSDEEEFFELRVYYRLSEHLDLELSQDGDEGAFAGIRYSKQADSFTELVRKGDLLDRPKKEEGLPVRWEFEGLPMGSGLSLRLRDSLTRVEGLLDSNQLDQARLIMKETINNVLAEEGFLDARYTIQAYERRVRTLPGRGKSSLRRFEFGRVRISFVCGASYRLEGVEMVGWPPLIPLPDEPWLSDRHLRRPLIQSEGLKTFQNSLLNALSDRGYALAELVSLRLDTAPMAEGSPLLEGLTTFPVKSDSNSEELWHGEVPVILRLEIDPGKRQVIVQHFIEGIQSISHDRAMELLGAKDGDIFIENRVLDYPRKLLNWYQSQGYFDTQVEIRRILQSKRYPRLSLHLSVKEGSRWNIGEIKIEGLERSDSSYLVSVGGLESGARANPKELESSMRRIGKLPHIRSLSHRWGELKEGNRDLILVVEEHPLWRFSSRLGYESGEGQQLSFRLQRSNLFGKGEEGALESDFSPEEQRHVTRYRRESPMLAEWIEQWTLGIRERDISSQELENQTWLASFSLLDSDEMNIRSWGLSYREDRNIEGEAPSIRMSWLNDRYPVTAPRRPGRGWSWKLSQQVVAYFDRNRYALIGEGRLAYGFKFGGSTLVPWFRAGQAWPLGPKDPLPLADRFFLGGAGSLRGFDRDEITGKAQAGGESLLSYGSELFYPVLDWVDGSLFYEWGRVYDGYHYDQGGTRGHSIGMGLVFRTPVGPIEGFFAHPLGVKRTGRVGFQLGTIF